MRAEWVFSPDSKSLTLSDYNDKIHLLGVTHTLTATLAISGAGSITQRADSPIASGETAGHVVSS